MSISLEKIRAKLAALDNYQSGDKDGKLWKPAPGKQVVRILPNFQLSDNVDERPFVPLYFYHEFGKKYQLAPSQFDRPDPVFEMYKEMYKDSDPEVREMAKKLNSKVRFFVPVLVRGQEADGVQFWGFGFNVYNDLKNLYDDPQWGNISDLENGVDLTVEFIPSPVKDDQRQAKTMIVPFRKASNVTEDANLLAQVKATPDIVTQFKEPTYDELKTALENYLGVSKAPAKEQGDFDPKALNLPPTPKAPVSKDVEDVEAAFEAIINKKG